MGAAKHATKFEGLNPKGWGVVCMQLKSRIFAHKSASGFQLCKKRGKAILKMKLCSWGQWATQKI
tara:strand:+ start:75 stop:269 length:195 start_codon:yes stop_codon:yes gene_type:complete